MNPIEAAVLPMKSEAIERADRDARELIDRIINHLKNNQWNLDVAVPAQNNVWANDYKANKAKRSLYRSVTTYTQASRSFRDPEILKASEANEDRFIKAAKELAAAQYEAFVAKLVVKIGEVKDAKLAGSHVWGHSILTVTKTDGTIEHWKTQQIVNQSKLGTLFNQWPSRKIK